MATAQKIPLKNRGKSDDSSADAAVFSGKSGRRAPISGTTTGCAEIS